MPLSISLYKSGLNLYFCPALCTDSVPYRVYDMLPYVLKLSYPGIFKCPLCQHVYFRNLSTICRHVISAIVSFQILNLLFSKCFL